MELYIEMDTWMTYQNYITFSYAFIERKFITRWLYNAPTLAYHINRSYFRENPYVSQLVPTKVKYFYSAYDYDYGYNYVDNSKGMMCVKKGYVSTGSISTNDVYTTVAYSYLGTSNVKIVPSSSPVIFYPLIFDNDSATYLSNAAGSVYQYYQFSHVLYTVPRLPKTKEIYFFPYCLKDFAYNPQNHGTSQYPEVYSEYNQRVKTVSDGTDYPCFGFMQNFGTSALDEPLPFTNPLQVTALRYGDPALFNFERNTQTGKTFDKKYIPALLDDNFYSITWGEDDVYSQLPLFPLLRCDNIKMYYIPDVLSGARIYHFSYTTSVPVPTIPTTELIFDPLKTITIAKTPITLDVINDRSANWFMDNVGQIMGLGMQLISGLVGAIASRGVSDTITEMVKWSREKISNSEQLDYDKLSTVEDYRAGYLDVDTYDRKMRNISNKENAPDNPRVTFGSNLRDIAAGAENIGNVVFAKDQLEQLGSYNTDTIFASYIPRYIVQCSNKIDDIAWYFHMNGYLVNEYYYGSNLIAYITNRYYFNIIKTGDIEFTISVLISEHLRQSIKDRFAKGMRFWRHDANILSTVNYDNVEVTL